MALLKEAVQHLQNPAWLREHGHDLHYEIVDKNAKNQMLIIYPYMVANGISISTYNDVVFDMLMQERDKIDGKSFILMEDLSDLKHAFKNPPVPLETMLTAYIELLKTSIYNKSSIFDYDLITSVNLMASFVQKRSVQAQLDQTLLLCFNSAQDETGQGIKYGEKAYNYYRHNKDFYNTGISAYAIAAAYRLKEETEKAFSWLDKASKCFTQTEYPAQYAIIANEYGMIYYNLQEYEKASQWLRVASRESGDTFNSTTRAAIQECYGLSLIFTKQLDQAENILDKVYNHWKEKENFVNQCRVLHTMAYASYTASKTKQAYKLIEAGKVAYAHLTPTEFNKYLIEQLEALEDQLHKEGREG